MSTDENPGLLSDGDLGRVAVKLLFCIAEEWDLTEVQCCILVDVEIQRTLKGWRQKLDRNESFVGLPPDTLRRLSYLAGIYKGLQALFADPQRRKYWIRKPNQDFGGASALDRMMSGKVSDLAEVRCYLDSWCEDHYT